MGAETLPGPVTVRAIAASASDSLLVATDSADQPMGWLQAHAAHLLELGFRVEIFGLVVSSAARRAGVGRALIVATERRARSLGAQTIVVCSNIVRTEGHWFYPALGYSAAKTQHVYQKSLLSI
jgi:GNAT superfamily N-acetyltransferase